MTDDLFSHRKSLSEIIEVPKKVTSVYSMVQHIWNGDEESSRRESCKSNRVRLATVEEFDLDSVRSYMERFLGDIASNEGQGYWILAHFGVGKSHMMAVESILAVGGPKVWDLVKKKEDGVKNLGPGARLDRFRTKVEKRKIFPIIFTLEGKGGTKENRLVDFILSEAGDMFEARTGKVLATTPSHHLAKWYLEEGCKDYEKSLKAFMANRRLMEDLPKFGSHQELFSALQDPGSVGDAAMVIRTFLRSKKIKVEVCTEQDELLEHAFKHILGSGYDGILIVIDEMSEYMNRTKYSTDDEDCLLTLSSKLAKGKKMPVWTVVAAQAAYAKQDKLIGQDRMRQELLDHKPERFRHIVINRCRSYKIENGTSQDRETHNYFLGYRERIPWVKRVDEDEFKGCFPFPPEAVEVIQSISRQLTGTRSTIGFLHSALQKTLAAQPDWNELIAMWRIFDELMTYEESKSNSASGNISLKSIFRKETEALESAHKRLGRVETGLLAKQAGRRRAERIINTLFLYRIGGYGGLSVPQILDAVCDLKGDDNTDIQISHYEVLLEEMKAALHGQILYRDGKYEFTTKETGDFDSLVDAAIEALRADTGLFWKYFDDFLFYSDEPKSPFAEFRGATNLVRQTIHWHGQERTGLAGMRDLTIKGRAPDPDTSSSEHDFVVILSKRSTPEKVLKEYLKDAATAADPRVVVWVPTELNQEQKTTLVRIFAYLKVKTENPGTKIEKDAKSNYLFQCENGYDILKQLFQQGKAFTARKALAIDWTGGMSGALEKMAGDALDSCYKSASIDMGRRQFATEEAVKLINGLIKTGKAVSASDKLYGAVENFAKPMGLVRSADPEKLNPSGSPVYREIKEFAQTKGSHPVPMSVFYNQFCGWQATDGDKSWGLTRRIVDIFLLTLVQQGSLKIHPRKGPPIEKTSIANIDFKPETLRNFENVELPQAWSDWSAVSPYLEVLVDAEPETYGPNFDQSGAQEAIAKLKGAWVASEKLSGLAGRVSALFKDLGQKDPYDDLLLFWTSFFEVPLDSEIETERYDVFKGSLVKTFNKESVGELSKKELTKFQENWKQLRALLAHFDDMASLVRSAGWYARTAIPQLKEYKALEKAIEKLKPMVTRAHEFLVEPDRVRAELEPALETVWREYQGPFQHGVGEINDELKRLRKSIQSAQESDARRVLTTLAIGVPKAEEALAKGEQEIQDADSLQCDSLPTGEDLKKELQAGDSIRTSTHAILRLSDLVGFKATLSEAGDLCRDTFNKGLLAVATLLLDSGLRERLAKFSESVVKGLLKESKPSAVKDYLSGLKEGQLEELAKLIKASLKNVDFVSVNMREFQPGVSILWSDDELEQVANELKKFLKNRQSPGKVIRLE